MKPTQRHHDEFARYYDDLTELDFYHGRAAELRVPAMPNSVGLKAICAGLLMIVAFPVPFAVSAASLHALTSNVSARSNAAPIR